MTDDLVARLRNKRAWDLGNLDEMDEAADEIERLRAELDAERQSKGTHHLWERIRILNAARKSAEAERDELRAELAAASGLLRCVRKWKVSGDAELAARIDATLKDA